MSRTKPRYAITSDTDGSIVYWLGDDTLEAAQWWQGVSRLMDYATTAQLAVIMGVEKRTMEGWRQGRAVAARFRPGIANALSWHYDHKV